MCDLIRSIMLAGHPEGRGGQTEPPFGLFIFNSVLRRVQKTFAQFEPNSETFIINALFVVVLMKDKKKSVLFFPPSEKKKRGSGSSQKHRAFAVLSSTESQLWVGPPTAESISFRNVQHRMGRVSAMSHDRCKARCLRTTRCHEHF